MHERKNGVVDEMIKGYGPNFPGLAELFAMPLTEKDRLSLEEPIPALGRYAKSVAFLKDVTSGKAVGLMRFKVIIEYFIALNNQLAEYTGKHRKITGKLTAEDIAEIRKIGTTLEEVKQAEFIEKFTEHDTAAAGDFIKLKIATKLPHLEDQMEGIHFGCTSEDVMGNVFGLIANDLVFKHFLDSLLDFCLNVMFFVEKHEGLGPLILPALTHEQAATPTTLGQKLITQLVAIDYHLSQMKGKTVKFQPFSGKMGGPIGNLDCHYAAYPDIDWISFAKDFVEGMGLHYETMTNQCVSYAVEAQHFTTIGNILTHIIKLVKDFVNMASCPSQFFVKEKKKGTKGSSIMPNKSNAWKMEGALGMLSEARDRLFFLARELPNYPHEGNMARSYLFRNIGDAFLPIFIGLGRITEEIKTYKPNPEKITNFFNEYPGMAGGCLQTVLKRQGVSGDAYRLIQEISINPDGTYANAEQFKKGFEEKVKELGLPEDSREELARLLKPDNLIGLAHLMTLSSIENLKIKFKTYRAMCDVV